MLGLALLPTLLPAIDLMPWTGWVTFEEFDLAVLAVAAGSYARMARTPVSRQQLAPGSAPLKGLLLLAYGAAILVSMLRGFADAGGFVFGWWQGLQEPMNSVRLAKSFFLALVLLPVWRSELRAAPDRAARLLAAGLAGGLAVVSLLALWERWAYTGLANFSTDYRTTALFWEMNVGGATFDGFLALTMPFAVRELARATDRRHWLPAAAAVLLGAYACLTTFSRGVYAAVPVGLAVMAGLAALQARRRPQLPTSAAAHVAEASRGSSGALAATLGVLLFALAAAWVFPSSGYRGLLALFGAVLILLPMAEWLRPLPARAWTAGLALGAVASLLAAALAVILPKGAYIGYAMAWSVAAAILWWLRASSQGVASPMPGAMLLAVFCAVLTAMLEVGHTWGGDRGLQQMTPVAFALALLAVVGGARARPCWPVSWRWQGTLAATLASLSVLVGVLLGGAYMDQRFTTGTGDLDRRILHWENALQLLNGPMDWTFGKGMGRFPANHFMSGRTEDEVGDYRLRGIGAGEHLVLTGGKHVLGWGELFRVSQRIGAFRSPVTVQLDARAGQATALHFEICRKHLLYDDGCTTGEVRTRALPGQWQTVTMRLPDHALTRGDWFAPHFLVFSMAIADSGRSVEIDNLQATDARGRQLLANGDFSDGMARWFFTSDRYHLPWHMKNMLLHVLFEQGWVGLSLFLAITIAALWRVTAGGAREHPIAPALAGAIFGFEIVGLFDSLVDAPRLACLFYLILMVALTLRASRARAFAP
jgi:hypothetical protein